MDAGRLFQSVMIWGKYTNLNIVRNGVFSSCFDWVVLLQLWTISLGCRKNVCIIIDKFIHEAKSHGSSKFQ